MTMMTCNRLNFPLNACHLHPCVHFNITKTHSCEWCHLHHLSIVLVVPIHTMDASGMVMCMPYMPYKDASGNLTAISLLEYMLYKFASSLIGEKSSEMQYLVWIVEFHELSNFWTQVVPEITQSRACLLGNTPLIPQHSHVLPGSGDWLSVPQSSARCR